LSEDQVGGLPTCSYEANEGILFVTHPERVELKTRGDIEAYFDFGVRYWRRHCSGVKVYMLVDYQNLAAELDEIDFYAAQVRRVVSECAVTIIRYNGDLLQRMAGRMTAIKLHTPSNMYPDRDAALAVVRGIKQGTVRLTAG
jgi:hypothetical protein